MWTSGMGGRMKRKRYTDEQIAYALRQAESGTSLTLLAAGKGMVLDFHGPPFRYRSTYARNAEWATVGNQSLTDEEV